MKELLEVFCTFFKIGVLTFGGGYTMLPMLNRDIVKNLNWATEEEVIDYYAISQSLPGIVAVNTAMLIGYKKRNVSGMIAAALGVVCPSVIIILTIALFIKNFLGIESVMHAFNGIRTAVAALIVNTTVDMGRKCLIDPICVVIGIAALLAFTFVDISPIIPVVGGAAAGIAARARAKR
ncbi:MAG: chromate transporter [Synergistaceae bacterium]|jgi:chromate transporter|nr:chromate transporter [Synergistaceae bacterium]